MIDEYKLLNARELANGLRYSEDRHDTNYGKQPATLDEITNEFYRTSIEINKFLTPKLEAALINVCNRLQLHRKVVSAFVNNSTEIQAACYYVEDQKCLLRLSSALVNLLEIKEIEFVLGHEIGHFLLKHAPIGFEEKSAEYFVFQRAKEISADRIGLIACGNLQTAGSALMKAASGLDTKHLEVNLSRYLLQLEHIKDSARGENPFGTHPSVLLRTFAINEFALGLQRLEYFAFNPENVYQRDIVIKRFLDEYSDKQLNRQLDDLKFDLKMWLAAKEIAKDQTFTKTEQSTFKKLFGEPTLKKLKMFFSEIELTDIHSEIDKKISECKSNLMRLAPSETNRIEADLSLFIETQFRRSEF